MAENAAVAGETEDLSDSRGTLSGTAAVVLLFLNRKDVASPSMKGVPYFLPAPLGTQKEVLGNV